MKEIGTLERTMAELKNQQTEAADDRFQIETDVTSLQTIKKRVQKQLNGINLRIDKSMKEVKKLEMDNSAIVSYNKE